MSLLSPRFPIPLCLFAQSRLASTASSQGQHAEHFPFPKHSNPTPHEIFHLPYGASQNAIKSRYYELVRIYHPDAASNDLSSSVSHSRFQAISEAYGLLSGKRSLRSSQSRNHNSVYEEELLRRRKAQWRASASSDEFGHEGHGGRASSWEQEKREKWDQHLLVLIVIFALTVSSIPLSVLSPFAMGHYDRRHEEARKNLANARQEARQLADFSRSAKPKEREIENTPDK